MSPQPKAEKDADEGRKPTPAKTVEQGPGRGSSYQDAPDKPHESTVAQVEVLPD